MKPIAHNQQFQYQYAQQAAYRPRASPLDTSDKQLLAHAMFEDADESSPSASPARRAVPLATSASASSSSSSSFSSSSSSTRRHQPWAQATPPRTLKNMAEGLTTLNGQDSLSPSKYTPKKKVFAVSKASLETFNPAYSMGLDIQSDAAHSNQGRDAPPAHSTAAAKPIWSQAGPYDSSWQMSPTPELEAFAMPDLQTALGSSSSSSYDPLDSTAPYQSPVTSPVRPQNKRSTTLASVFEDEPDNGSVGSSKNSQAPAGRRVAFKVRNGSQDSGNTSPLKMTSSTSASSSSSTGSFIARFFNWKKSGKASGKKGDPSAASSTSSSTASYDSTLASAYTNAHGLSPTRDFDSGSESTGGSLPATPTGLAVAVHHLPGTGGHSPLMPHRKNDPPPKSILKKQSAPALRRAISKSKIKSPSRSAEAPPALPTSRSSSSVSSVGQGVARNLSTSSGVSALQNESPTKRPQNAPPVKQLYSVTAGPSSNKQQMKKQNQQQQREQMAAGRIPPPRYPPPMRPQQSSPFETERRTMASRVADGALNNSRGFEEPAPRRMDSSLSAETLAVKQNRRRSRSVGALDSGDDPFSNAFADFSRRQPPPAVPLSQPPMLSLPSLGSFGYNSKADSSSALTPTQPTVVTFPSLSRHKAQNSVESTSSDSSGEEKAEPVQARRVQLGARARATPLASPSLTATRSPNIASASLQSAVNVPVRGASSLTAPDQPAHMAITPRAIDEDLLALGLGDVKTPDVEAHAFTAPRNAPTAPTAPLNFKSRAPKTTAAKPTTLPRSDSSVLGSLHQANDSTSTMGSTADSYSSVPSLASSQTSMASSNVDASGPSGYTYFQSHLHAEPLEYEQAQRYQHRAQLSADAFVDLYNDGRPSPSLEDELTPKMSSLQAGQFNGQAPAPRCPSPNVASNNTLAPPQPSINVTLPGQASPQLPSLDLGGSLGLGLDFDASARKRPMQFATRTAPSSRAGARSITPTQQYSSSPSPRLPVTARHLNAYSSPLGRPIDLPEVEARQSSQRAVTTPPSQIHKGFAPAQHGGANLSGLGLDLENVEGLGQVRLAEPSLRYATSFSAQHGDGNAEVGMGRWEDHRPPPRMQMQAAADKQWLEVQAQTKNLAHEVSYGMTASDSMMTLEAQDDDEDPYGGLATPETRGGEWSMGVAM